MKALSRKEQVFKFFTQQCAGMPRKHLVKMTYMADLLAHEYLGKSISGFDYVVYHFGPYPLDTKEIVASLEEKGLVWEKDRARADSTDYSVKKLFDSGEPVVFTFSRAENEILAFVVRTYLNMDTDELVEDVVYQTEPFKAALRLGRLKAPIPMDIVNRQGLNEIGFDLEQTLERERIVEEGGFTRSQDFVDGLRNRIAARHPE